MCEPKIKYDDDEFAVIGQPFHHHIIRLLPACPMLKSINYRIA